MSLSTIPPTSLEESRFTDLQKIASSGITKDHVEVYERFEEANARVVTQRIALRTTLGLLAIGAALLIALVVHFIFNPSGWAFGSTGFITALTGYFFKGFYHVLQHSHPVPKSLPPQTQR